MKILNIKNIISSLVVVFLLGCSNEVLDDINTNPNAPTDVPISLLLPQATISTIYGVAGDGAGQHERGGVEEWSGPQ